MRALLEDHGSFFTAAAHMNEPKRNTHFKELLSTVSCGADERGATSCDVTYQVVNQLLFHFAVIFNKN